MNELVIIESPWRGKCAAEQLRNRRYAIRAMQDSVLHNEIPFASHLLYTQFLREDRLEERNKGIEMGLEWGKYAAKTVVYIDWGITAGMAHGIRRAIDEKRWVEYRNIPTIVPGEIDTLNALCFELAEFFGVSLEKLQSSCRGQEVVIPRMVYYAVARKLFPGISFKTIGEVVKHNHSAVLLGIQNLELKHHLTKAYNAFCTDRQLLEFEPCPSDLKN